MSSVSAKAITIYYDGKCGLCRREIAHYQRIAPTGIFAWVDITVTPEAFTTLGYTVSDGLKALHVADAGGIVHIGVGAFVVIWRQLPRWRLLAWLVNLPIVRPLAEISYNKFAAWRFKRLGYDRCEL